jgi:hypothetical protein
MNRTLRSRNSLVREIQDSKFATSLFGGLVVSTGSIFSAREGSKKFSAAIQRDVGFKSTTSVTNANVSRLVILLLIAIVDILGASSVSKVASLIIQSVMVAMVNKHSGWRRHNLVVHIDRFSFSEFSRCSTDGIPALSVITLICKPVPLHEVLKVLITNPRHLAARKWDFLRSLRIKHGKLLFSNSPCYNRFSLCCAQITALVRAARVCNHAFGSISFLDILSQNRYSIKICEGG